MIRVFQGSRGKFTVAVEAAGRELRVAFALCNKRDQFVRRVGFHRATGLLDAQHDNPNVIDLPDYHGDDPRGEIVAPLFKALEELNVEAFRHSDDRVDNLQLAISSAAVLTCEAVSA